MGDRRKAESRKPHAQRPNTGCRKAAGSTRKQQSPEKENTTCPKPKPLTKKQSVSSSDVDAAELLIGLGTARNHCVPASPRTWDAESHGSIARCRKLRLAGIEDLEHQFLA
ncbi:hypothetical protein B0H14DRAFT_2590858 [Mycena olivaceomarginata]|nr:hypothetical protein B0H14DRAFT_2590858 [Mycena olivaceomarginata]